MAEDARREHEESQAAAGDAAPLSVIWPLLGRHIAFHRRLVDLTSSVKAALLLSQSIYWTRHGRDIARNGGWFHKTTEQWAIETGLSPKEQASAREVLRNLALLDDQRIGIPARLHFRLRLDELGARLAEKHGLPIYLYEDAASSEARRNLATIRKGEFEGLAEKMKSPEWKPDFGPDAPHPTAGATVVGARSPLIAYNINLGTADLSVADRIAKSIRHLSGGFRFVKAMGVRLEARGIVQVSINMTNYEKTPLHRVFETVRSEAERFGVPVVGSEIVGLVPQAALVGAAEHYLRLEAPASSQVLENKLLDVAFAGSE